MKKYEILKEKAEAELIVEQKKAEGITAVGKAQAEEIRVKLLAEAEGLEAKAKAMAKMQQAAVIEMVVDKLPEIVKNASLPLTNVNSITMYGEGNSSKLVGDIMTTTNKIIEGIEGSIGLDIKSIISSTVDGILLTKKNEETNTNEIIAQVTDNLDEN
jgi:flotillin